MEGHTQPGWAEGALPPRQDTVRALRGGRGGPGSPARPGPGSLLDLLSWPRGLAAHGPGSWQARRAGPRSRMPAVPLPLGTRLGHTRASCPPLPRRPASTPPGRGAPGTWVEGGHSGRLCGAARQGLRPPLPASWQTFGGRSLARPYLALYVRGLWALPGSRRRRGRVEWGQHRGPRSPAPQETGTSKPSRILPQCPAALDDNLSLRRDPTPGSAHGPPPPGPAAHRGSERVTSDAGRAAGPPETSRPRTPWGRDCPPASPQWPENPSCACSTLSVPPQAPSPGLCSNPPSTNPRSHHLPGEWQAGTQWQPSCRQGRRRVPSCLEMGLQAPAGRQGVSGFGGPVATPATTPLLLLQELLSASSGLARESFLCPGSWSPELPSRRRDVPEARCLATAWRNQGNRHPDLTKAPMFPLRQRHVAPGARRDRPRAVPASCPVSQEQAWTLVPPRLSGQVSHWSPAEAQGWAPRPGHWAW